MATAPKAKPVPVSSAKAKQSQSNTTLYLVGGGLLLLVILAVVLLVSQNRAPAAETTTDVPAEWIDGMSFGDPNAPVVIQMWEDFMCPHCQNWTATYKPQIVDQHVKAGTVRLEYHPFPLQQFAPASQMGAQAAYCAADQNQFWPMHDRLFTVAASRGQAGMEYDNLRTYAGELGLDVDAWSNCMNNQTHRQTMLDSLTQAQALGLTGTPTIIVNDQVMPNSDDINAINAAIEAAAGS